MQDDRRSGKDENEGPGRGRSVLRRIARRAMVERGLEPDFAPAVRAEPEALVDGPAEPGPAIRDLRSLPWCSIDNDSSRDLDQLTVAEPGANDVAVRILVAIADVDALVKKGFAVDAHASGNTTSVYTAAEIGDRFDAIVTGASAKGTWVHIYHPAAEGKIVEGFEGLDVGDRIRVELVKADVQEGFVDFARERRVS